MACSAVFWMVGCKSSHVAPTDISNLTLTSEEKTTLERDEQILKVVQGVNKNSKTSISEIFPDAIALSDLQYWCGNDRPDARAKIKQAIASGANVNEKNNDGYAPLHCAAENGALENVKILVANGADISAKTAKGLTPLDFAKNMNHDDVVTFLELQY